MVLHLNPGLITQSLMQHIQSACRVPVSLASPSLASMSSLSSSGFQNARTSATQRSAPSGRNQQPEGWRILQDTQAKIFEVTQNLTMNRAQTRTKAFKSVDEYIRS